MKMMSGFEAPRQRGNPARKPNAVDVAQVNIADEQSGVVRASESGRFGKLHRDAAHTDEARIQDAVDGSCDGAAEAEFRRYHGRAARDCRWRIETQDGEPDRASHASQAPTKKKLSRPEPQSGDLVNEGDRAS